MENADLNKIRHFKGSVADFKNYFDQRAGENTNAFGTPDYQGFNDVHPTRGANKSSHWDDVHEAKKTYKKGDKLKVKLKNGKEFDITFDSYSSNKGVAYGKIDGDRKPFSLDSVVDEANEANTKGFDIFGYKTKDFDICPGAESLYKRIVDEEELPISKGKMTDSEKEMVRQSAELQDLLYAREKRALKIGAGKSDVKAAEDLAKKIMSLAKKMGLEKEHGYIQGHVDKIKSKMITEEIDREVGHTDDEPGMIADDLRIIERYARELRELVESEGMKGETDFPHWWQSKIVLAKEYLVKAKHYLRGELEKDSSDQAVPTFENYKHKG